MVIEIVFLNVKSFKENVGLEKNCMSCLKVKTKGNLLILNTRKNILMSELKIFSHKKHKRLCHCRRTNIVVDLRQLKLT